MDYLRTRWKTEHFSDSAEDERVLRDDARTRDDPESQEEAGDEVEMTEVNAPPPAMPETKIRDNLEDREAQAQRTNTVFRHASQEDKLTEIAAPRPARPDTNTRDSLENSTRKARGNGAGGRQRPHDTDMTGPSVPAPVHNGKPPSDEETTTGSPQDHKSLEERQQGHNNAPAPAKRSRVATELYTISWLIWFSILGTLARLGVEAITLYPGSPFPSRVLWANLGGSLFMGFLLEDRSLFREEWGSPDPEAPAANHGKVKKTLPLFIGLSTGFCGSFTSFSSFVRDAFLALTNALDSASPTSVYHTTPTIHPRNGGFSFLALCAILVVQTSVSIAAFTTGAHFALLLQPVTPTIPFRFTRRILDPLSVLLGPGCWLGAVFLAIWPPGDNVHWRFRAVFPLVFAPLGCLLRFYASKHLNGFIPSFPLGTFAVNIFGTMVLGMAWDLQHASSIRSANACLVLEGVSEGFCGCLTTVSTWVAELVGLRRRHAWVYGLTSVGVALGFMVVIMGSMGWTIGFQKPACS